MILGCFDWIPNLWFSLVNAFRMSQEKGFGPFPDDILIDVLSRLPAHDVLKCRVVCKRWCALTSSRHFIELQSKKAPTIVYGECHTSNKSYTLPRYFLIEGRNTNVMKELHYKYPIRRRNFFPVVLGSCGGLLVFMIYPPCGQRHVLYNPNLHEGTSISFPWIQCNYVCGVFYHPLESEYRFISVQTVATYSFSYHIYSPKAKEWRCISKSPSCFRPPRSTAPVVLNSGLHWLALYDYRAVCSVAVIVFRMASEELSTFPLPCSVSALQNAHPSMALFEMDKQLCLGYTNVKGLYIWILEDYANKSWVMKHWVAITRIPHVPSECDCLLDNYDYRRLQIINMKKDELLINWCTSGIYVCHLTLKTFRRIEDKRKKSSTPNFYVWTAYKSSLAMPHF